MLSFLDWFEAIRYRWKLVALTTAVMAALAIVYIGVAPKTYTATASLLLDDQAPDPLDEESRGNSENRRAIIATQADLVRSPHVAGNAAALTGLSKDPRYIAKWRDETGERQPFADWLRIEMSDALSVEPGKDTNILLIKTSTGDPIEAARLANGFARASVASQYRLRTEPAKAYADWLAKRKEAARGNVVEAQKTLSGFVRQTGITNDGDLSAEGSQMAEVANQLAAAEARAAAARQPIHSGPQSRGDAERSTTIQQLRQQVAEKSGRLADLQAMFGPEYPDVQRTQAEVATLESRLNSELRNATGAFSSARAAEARAAREATAASESRLRSLSSEQRSRVQTMAANLAQYHTLRNEFEAAQRVYNDLNQRLSKMRLQGNLPLTEVQVLDTASPPVAPSSPKVGLTLVLASFLGLLIGIAAAILLEFLNPRVRSWGGVERLLGVRVIGRLAMPTPHSKAPLLLEGRVS